MKKVFVIMGILLLMSIFTNCSSNDEIPDIDSGKGLKMEDAESYDPVYQVKYYNQYPDLEIKQGYWTKEGYIDLIPQNAPPYKLLVCWNSEQGKKAIDYVLENNQYVITKDAYIENNNEYRITSNVYFESPYFYISTYYKSSEFPTIDRYSIVVLPQIMLKMKEGCSLESIKNDYADIMKYRGWIAEDLGICIFDCNLKTSHALLKLNSEIYQRGDVEFSDFNTYGSY